MIKSPRAACLGVTEIFYGPHVDLRQEPEEERIVREAACRTICAKCEILWPCLRWALVEEEPWGVWGGMPYRQRQKFRRFLRNRHDGEIPDEETVQEELHHFLVAERKKERDKKAAAKAAKKNRDGTGPVVAGNRGGRRTGKQGAVQRKAPDRSTPVKRNAGKPDQRAAPKRKLSGN